jgi:hypothetical protein
VIEKRPEVPIGDCENTLSFPGEETSLGSGLSSHLPGGDAPCPSSPSHGFLHHTIGTPKKVIYFPLSRFWKCSMSFERCCFQPKMLSLRREHSLCDQIQILRTAPVKTMVFFAFSPAIRTSNVLGAGDSRRDPRVRRRVSRRSASRQSISIHILSPRR